jgi:Sec-independent protein translocase protein TatA
MFGLGPIEMLIVGAISVLLFGIPVLVLVLLFRVLRSPGDGIKELKERVRRLEEQTGDSRPTG